MIDERLVLARIVRVGWAPGLATAILAMAASGCGGQTADRSQTADDDASPASTSDGSALVDGAAEAIAMAVGDATGVSDAGSASDEDSPEDTANVGTSDASGSPEAEPDSVNSSALNDFAADGSVIADATVIGPPTIGNDGYVTVDAGSTALLGYVGSYIGGSASTITLTYASTAFCASGSVGPNGAYQSYAGAGFNVDQTVSSEGGTATSIPIEGSSMTLSYQNFAGSPLRLQIIDTSYNYWCYTLTQAAGPVTIPMSNFNSHCWDGSGESFQTGTSISALQLIVPGSDTVSIPFNFCFLGVTIQ